MQSNLKLVSTLANNAADASVDRATATPAGLKLLTETELLLVGGGDGAPDWGYPGPEPVVPPPVGP